MLWESNSKITLPVKNNKSSSFCSSNHFHTEYNWFNFLTMLMNNCMLIPTTSCQITKIKKERVIQKSKTVHCYWKVKFRLRRWFGRTIYFLRMSQEKMNNQRISGKKFRFLNVWSFSYYRFPAFINYCFWCSSNATKSSKLSIIHVMQTSKVKTVCVYTKSSLWVSIYETYNL